MIWAFILSKIPFTKRLESSSENILAKSMASLIETMGGMSLR